MMLRKKILLALISLSPFISQSALVNFDLSGSYDYDAYATGEEIVANGAALATNLGDHKIYLGQTSGWGHLVDPANLSGTGYKGITNTTINGGEFELGAGLTGDKFGTALGTTKVNNSIASLQNVTGNLATRTKTIMLEVAQQAKYSDFNLLVNGQRYGTRSGVVMGALIEVKYVGDATWHTVWSESVDISTAGTLGGVFGGNYTGSTYSFQSADWDAVIVNNLTANGIYKNNVPASGTDSMWKLATPATLDSSKVLEGFRLTSTTTDAARYNDFILYAASATEVIGPSTGPCNLVFTNTAPAQFIQKPFVTTNLAFVVRNDGYDATNVTISLATNYPWLSNLSGSNAVSAIGAGASVTSLFNVAIASNAPVGVYSNAFTLNMQGTGTAGGASNFTANVGLEIINTVSASLSKIAFSAATNGTDTATLTVSNEAAFALSIALTNSPSAAWLTYATPVTVPANSSTGIVITANGSLTAGSGQYSTSLAVIYLNNTSLPNPTNFPIVFDVGAKIEPLISSASIVEAGGVNLLSGQYEPGEILNITIPSTNNGAIAVSNIVHTLSANPAYFTISAITNFADYAALAVGAATTTTYQVTISASTPQGSYPFTATNSADGTSWANTRSLSVISFADVAKVDPLLSSAVIIEAGGVNSVPGQYEPGEILNITIVSTNSGSITVSNVTHTLDANPAYFTVVPVSNSANYASLAIGGITQTTYQVTISASTPNGAYSFFSTNSANGTSWISNRSLAVLKYVVPTNYSITSSMSHGYVNAAGDVSTSALYAGDISAVMYSTVVMFQLPALPAGYKVVSADLLMDMYQTSYAAGGIDLYALRTNASATITAADFYSGAYGASAGHAPIMDEFVPKGAPAASYSVTNSAIQSNLASWVQSQYAAGATSNYAFFGLSPDTASSGSSRARFSLANDATPAKRPTLTFTIADARACDLVYTNKTPSQFLQRPFVTTNLSFAVRNDGYDASGVTVSLTVNPSYSGWLTVNTGTSSIPLIATAETVTNYFNVSIASNAPVGVYTNAFTFHAQGIGVNGTTNTIANPVSLQILNTVFPSISKSAFVAPVGSSDTGTLTISNQAAFALSYSLSGASSWLVYPAGTLNLAAGATTNITLTADATLVAGKGHYTGTLAVSYLNNTSTPNPTNFPVIFDVGPKVEPLLSSAVITEAGGTNRLSGVYEPGEILHITIVSTNNGEMITVSNIVHTLSANGYFSITAISNAANYSSLTAGSTTSTTYQVVIASNTPEGLYVLTASNSANGDGPWSNVRSLQLISHAIPAVNPGSLTIAAVAGGTAAGSVTVTNGGNAAVNFMIGISGTWETGFTVSTNTTLSKWETGGLPLPLNDPSPNPVIGAGDSGQSDTIPIGFAFPLYGVNYTNLYVDANGAIILSSAVLTGNTNKADSTSGPLPLGNRPMIAPFRSSQLIVSNNPVRFVRATNPTRLIIIHDAAELSAYPADGTNLKFQTELFTNGQIQINYYNINGSQLDQVAVGVQGAVTGQVVNAGIIPASGKAIRLIPADDVWVAGGPVSGTVPAFSAVTVTFTNDASGQVAGTTNLVTAKFNWSGGGADNMSSNVTITATVGTAAPEYSAASSLSFTGAAGQVTSASFMITNSGTGPLSFTISNNVSASAGYLSTNPVFNWIDISTNGADVALNDPSLNPRITPEDEGFSAMIPVGFIFPFYGSGCTQLCVSVNGALRLDTTGRVIAARDLASTNSPIPSQLIVPFWADLALDSNATIKVHSNSERMVITWENIRQYGLNGGSNQTFQAVLKPSGEILFQYKKLEGDRWPGITIGLRDTALRTAQADIRLPGDEIISTNLYGHVSTQYISLVTNRTALFQSAQIQTIRYAPAGGTIAAGQTAEIEIIGDASNQSIGPNAISTNATLTISHNASGSPASLAVTFTVTNSQQTVFAAGMPIDDSDGDGLTDDAERIAGTDPQDAGSVFTPSVSRTADGTVLSWNYAAGRSYTVLYTTDLMVPFVGLTNGLQSGTFTHVTDAPSIYYKITVE